MILVTPAVLCGRAGIGNPEGSLNAGRYHVDAILIATQADTVETAHGMVDKMEPVPVTTDVLSKNSSDVTTLHEDRVAGTKVRERKSGEVEGHNLCWKIRGGCA